jgi:hypothetical protein
MGADRTPSFAAATAQPAVKRACPVVFVQTGSDDSDRHAFGEDLPDEAYRAVSAATAGWRDRKYMVKYLRGMVQEYDLPGLAVVIYPRNEDHPVVPPGLGVPFEPIPINETDDRLRNLLNSVDAVETGLEGGATRAPKAWFKRFAVRSGVPVVLFWLMLINLSFQWSNLFRLRGFGGLHALWISFLMTIALVILIIVLVRWWRGQWFLVPGGAVLRRGSAGRFSISLTRFVAADSILLVQKQEKLAGWHVEFWQWPKKWGTMMTDLEKTALLAAWRSTLPAPRLDQLDDLR